MESNIEKMINQVTSSNLFLKTVSTVINFNSYRKIWLQKTLEKVLKELELPVRRDQEKLLALVQELEIRIKKMQLEEESTIGADSSEPEKLQKRSKNITFKKNLSKVKRESSARRLV